ncbi:hypothetical protein [Shewanella sp.]|uniref:hypothetical protein n=1 Tax=Shewanella sp. TaxID=50422 RepID=UPI001ECD7837|nr:hypothetical protein [Shewanella sp.]NRB22306.1 hypothetical protein [Shewanella sp.]
MKEVKEGDLDPQKTLVKDLTKRLGASLSSYVVDNFKLDLDSIINTSEIAGTGFDASVWTEKASGKTYVALRGTDFNIQDLLTDSDLALTGGAQDQIASMVNWWLASTTPIGEQALQIKYQVTTTTNFVNWVEAPSIEGTGTLAGIMDISVTGHSLGGHLASAFTRLFGGQWNIEHTSTFNSAGFTASSEAIFNQIEALLGDGMGLGRYPDGNEQSNYFSENGINVVTNTFYFDQIGTRIPLFNEDSSLGVPNHFVAPLTDTLALGNMLAGLDSSFNIAQLNRLMAASSNAADASQETMLDHLGRLFVGDHITETPLGSVVSGRNSDIFYQNLFILQAQLFQNPNDIDLVAKGEYQGMSLVNLGDYTASNTLAENAKTTIGFMYALENLLPFALTNADAVYQAHNKNGQLDPNQFSEQYIGDRAGLLYWKLKYDLTDTSYGSYINPDDFDDTSSFEGNWSYRDLSQNITLNIDGNGTDVYRQIIFGNFYHLLSSHPPPFIKPPKINQQFNAAITSFQLNVQQSSVITDMAATYVHYHRRTGDF